MYIGDLEMKFGCLAEEVDAVYRNYNETSYTGNAKASSQGGWLRCQDECP